MRLGLRPTVFESGTEEWSKIRRLYGGAGIVWERHRHRYEVNPAYVERLQESGMSFIGKDEKGERMQICELKGAPRRSLSIMMILIVFKSEHPYFVGLQAHPEFCTRPLNPSPPFLGLVSAASSAATFKEQIARQAEFQPPHPKAAMVSEAQLKSISDFAQTNGFSDSDERKMSVVQAVNEDP